MTKKELNDLFKNKTIKMAIYSLIFGIGLFFVVGLFIGKASGVDITDERYEQLLEIEKSFNQLTLDYQQLEASNTTLQKDYDSISKEKMTLEEDNKNLKAKVEEATPWFNMKEDERKAAEAKAQADKEAAAKAEKERLAKEAAAKAEKERVAKAEEERKQREGVKYGAKSYQYKELEKNAEKYKGEKAKFTGEVVEIQELSDGTMMRVDITPTSYGYTDTIFVVTTINTDNIYKGDVVSMWGLLGGSHSYTSTAGWNITLPLFVAELIEK